MDITRIRDLQRLGEGRLTVLPGIEFRSDHGGKPIHYICIFPEDCDLEHVWTTLQGSLGLTPKAIKEKGGDEKVYVPIEEGAKEARKLGGLVSIHAGEKSNSIEGIQNGEEFQRRIKYDLTKNWVDIMEIGQLKDVTLHLNKIFPAIGLERPLVICSDNHNVKDYTVKNALWIRADPTFRGLLMVLREPQGRVFIGDRPPEHIRVEQNPTKYIKSISFSRKANAPAGEKWFDGKIQFNAGLVAIIGNKGSGKSALSDMLGLLGASKNAASFSFLSRERFRHPVGGFANYFEASLDWTSGESITHCLAYPMANEAVERLKCLPQDHVEKVCNELAGIGERDFEQELKGVIFSHVPESQRLGQSTLDELVEFQTSEKQKRVDSLIKQLREVSRSRAAFEAQANPRTKTDLQERLKRREIELDAHDKAKPANQIDPAANPATAQPNPILLQNLAKADATKQEIETKIAEAKQKLGEAQRRHAVAKRLLEKILNFEKEFAVFLPTLAGDASELGLKAAEMVSLTVKKEEAEKIRSDAAIMIASIGRELDETNSQGLLTKLNNSKKALLEFHTKLDEPERAYRAYLKVLRDWQEKRAGIEGSETDAESLKGLKAAISALANLPAQIASLRDTQEELALQIHAEKLAQTEVYRSLYEPVQRFIDTHSLAKDKLKLEFRAELTSLDFTSQLLGLLALNRRGSFFGIEEGRARTSGMLETTSWSDKKSVKTFLQGIDNALHYDLREDPAPPIQLTDQMPKGKKPEDVFNFMYGLDYVESRYILRWEGKDISMLSPGERGTLLLVFYLLIDKGDMPLIIDQPEGNLDNHTVAKVLVDCIREARKRRQVFIVTHNPNLAVVCDADQIVHASMDKADGNAITYTSGSLENPEMSRFVTDVLEGTRWAFGVRSKKYEVGT